jgi:hypothetical protein
MTFSILRRSDPKDPLRSRTPSGQIDPGGKPMRCYRCKGIMSYEMFYGPNKYFWGWKYICCGMKAEYRMSLLCCRIRIFLLIFRRFVKDLLVRPLDTVSGNPFINRRFQWQSLENLSWYEFSTFDQYGIVGITNSSGRP